MMGGSILISTMVLGVFESNLTKVAGASQNMEQQAYKIQAVDTLWNIASRFNTTLSGIAARHGVTVNALRETNQLSTDFKKIVKRSRFQIRAMASHAERLLRENRS
jgi:LysM repeat protein